MSEHAKPQPLGAQCEGVHDGWRKAMFCVIDTTTGIHTHVCHLHRRLLHNQFSTARSTWMKCGHQTDVAEPTRDEKETAPSKERRFHQSSPHYPHPITQPPARAM